MRPELSILIPTYNQNAFSLVESLSNQASQLDMDYEIVLYDDGSEIAREENSRVEEFPKARYQYFEQNRGRSSIRRKLCGDAKFDWLLLLDADVTPLTETFLQNYLETINAETDAVCGGVVYAEKAPEPAKMLRYLYGKEREATAAHLRNDHPYFILTGNLLIRKALFNEITQNLTDFYGEDLLISQRLKRNRARVLHIDNQIVHHGIESSVEYVSKSEEVLRNLARLEQSGEMDSDFTRLQKKYTAMKRSGLLFFVNAFSKLFLQRIKKNLISASPKLKYFDLYRLKYYSDLKKNA